MEYKKYYKNLGKSSDFIVLVINKVIPIINDKLFSRAAELSEFVNSSNIFGLKKRHLIWIDLIKNYTSLTTSMNNLIGFNHTINYARKIIVKELLAGKKYEDSKKKIQLISEVSEKFIEYTRSLLINLHYFSENLESDNTGVSKEVKSLGDVYSLINEALKLFIEKHLPKVKQINEEIMEKISKSGGFESNHSCEFDKIDEINKKLKDFSVSGGFEENHLYQVIIGGTDDESRKVMVGGFLVENYVKQQFISLQLMKQEIEKISSSNETEIKKYYENILPNLKKYSELIKLNTDQLFKHLLSDSGALNNIFQQFKNLFTVEIKKLLYYHLKRFNISNKLSIAFSESETLSGNIFYSDEYGKIDAKLTWNPDDIKKSINSLLNVIADIFHLIDKADFSKIMKDVKKCFKEIGNIENVDVEMQSLENDYEIINSKEFSFESRKNAKRAINDLIFSVQNLVNHPISLGNVIKVNFKHKNINFETKNSSEMAHNLEYLIDAMEYVVNTESAFIPVAQKCEKQNDAITNQLYNLAVEINTLISPDNKFTCIKRPSLVVHTGLKSVVLKHLLEKRFKNEKEKYEPELDRIISLINSLLDVDVNNFYDSKNGLNVKEIEKIIWESVGVVHPLSQSKVIISTR